MHAYAVPPATASTWILYRSPPTMNQLLVGKGAHSRCLEEHACNAIRDDSDIDVAGGAKVVLSSGKE
jgi:hypothetical protein